VNDQIGRPTNGQHLKHFVQEQLAAAFELAPAALFEPDLTLASIIAASPRLVNSVDFMECCARVANALRKICGNHITLPATTLNTPISVVVDSFLAQASGGKAS
jgi:hypothetical protein